MTLGEALERHRRTLTDPRDRALAMELVVGTLRWVASLDYILEATAGRSVGRLDSDVLRVLRLGAYQLLYLSRLPASAVVNDAVSLVKETPVRYASGLVNAVLRKIARGDVTLPPRPLWPRPDAAPIDRDEALSYLSITLSHPRWLVERWLDRWGFQAAEEWAQFNNSAASLTLRAQTARISRDALREALEHHGVVTDEAPFAPDALVVISGRPHETPLWDEGLFVIQDQASQLVGTFASAQPAERILDTCAAPGGKTLQFLAAQGGRGLVVAADRRPRRLRLLSRTLRHARAPHVNIVQLDLTSGLPFQPIFDLVFADVPCSGLGTLRRDPEIKWRVLPDDLPRLAAQQKQMLEIAASGVSIGGRLVYATCSSEPEENDDVIDEFLARRRDFEAVSRDELFHDAHAGVTAVVDEHGRFRTLPPRHQLEAFFAVCLRRVS